MRLIRFDGNCEAGDQEITFSIGIFLLVQEWKLASHPRFFTGQELSQETLLCLISQGRVLIARHVLAPQPVIFVMVKSG